jgi:hypothetical protein
MHVVKTRKRKPGPPNPAPVIGEKYGNCLIVREGPKLQGRFSWVSQCVQCKQERPPKLRYELLRGPGYCFECACEAKREAKRLRFAQEQSSGLRKCTTCKRSKRLDLFGACLSKRGGLSGVCRACSKQAQITSWATRMHYNAKVRARDCNRDFALTIQDIEALYVTTCPVLGIELDYLRKHKRVLGRSPSLDRVDNSKGYIPGNVQIISWRANNLKGNANADELRAIANYMELHMNV